jgi:tetratricopeptide (TPR) repeat protein
MEVMFLKMWEAGAPIGDGNEIGIPDIEYFDYLKDKSGDNDHYRSDYDYRDYAPREHNLNYDELLKMAKQSYENGNYGESLNYYNRALDWHYNEEVKCGKAECLHKLGRNDEASQLFYELGDRYAFGDDDKNIAVKYLKKSLECNPYNEDSLDILGYALRGLERYGEALTYYRQVKTQGC